MYIHSLRYLFPYNYHLRIEKIHANYDLLMFKYGLTYSYNRYKDMPLIENPINHGVTYFFYIFKNPTAKVIDVKSKTKSKWRPVALDTVVSRDQ